MCASRIRSQRTLDKQSRLNERLCKVAGLGTGYRADVHGNTSQMYVQVADDLTMRDQANNAQSSEVAATWKL